MRPPRPSSKPRSQKPPLNPGSLKAGMKGGAKSKLMTQKPPTRMAPGKDYLP